MAARLRQPEPTFQQCDWADLGNDQSTGPLVWWGWTSEEVSLRNTLSISLLLFFLAAAAYPLLLCSPTLRREVYAPQSTPAAPAPHPVRAWRASLRRLLSPPPRTLVCGESLELTLLLRYLRFNLRLLLRWGCVALPLMLGANALSPAPAGEPPRNASAHNHSAGGGEARGTLASLTISHLPSRSPALWVSAACMALLTLMHLSLAHAEWRAYCSLRHEWLLRHAGGDAELIGDYASLVKVGTPISAAALNARLRRVFPGEIYAVIPVAQSRLRDCFRAYWKGAEEPDPAEDFALVVDQGGPFTILRAVSKARPRDLSEASVEEESTRSSSASACSGAPRTHPLSAAQRVNFTLHPPPAKPAVALPPSRGVRRRRRLLDWLCAGWAEGWREQRAKSHSLLESDWATHATRAAADSAETEMRLLGGGSPSRRSERLSAVHPLRTLQAARVGVLPLVSEGIHEATTDLLALDPGARKFIVIFRTRRARSESLQLKNLFPVDVSMTIKPAPAPADMVWSNLYTPEVRANLVRGVAWAATIVFFLLWNVPVIAVQGLASIDGIKSLMKELGLTMFNEYLDHLSPDAIATVEGYVSTMILALFQVITLYGGPLYVLSYLMGFASHSRLMVSMLRKMWTFNFLLVLLASILISSLFTTASVFLNAGVCSILSRIGTAIPTHSSFFINFLLQQIFFFLPVCDVLCIGPLFVLPFSFLVQRCGSWCCRCGMPKTRALLRSFKLHTSLQHLFYPVFYARAELISNIAYVFACIAPVLIIPAILWFFLASLLWPYNLKYIYKPFEGANFDSGGVYWPTVSSQQLGALIVAQLALAAVHLLKSSVPTAFAIFVLSVATYMRGMLFYRSYSQRAKEISLQQSMELDAAVWASGNLVDDWLTGTQMPAGLASLLFNGRRIYEKGALPNEYEVLSSKVSRKVASRATSGKVALDQTTI